MFIINSCSGTMIPSPPGIRQSWAAAYCQPGYHPELVEAAGTSWWNWREERTEGSAFDFDFAHGGHGLDEFGIQQIDLWAKQLPYVMNCTSKGGKGRHWLVRLENPLPARTRVEHIQNCKAIKEKLAADLGVSLEKYICSFGGIQYIYAAKPAENGFVLLEKATEKLDVPPPEFVPPKPDNYECVALNPAQREHKGWLEGKGFAEWEEHSHCLNTHTAALVLLHEHFKMKGEFSTAATGKGLPEDRNCAAYPMKGGAWRIVRYNNGPEPGWDKTKNGNSTCVLNKAAPKEKNKCRHNSH